jgi:hypothetical protein
MKNHSTRRDPRSARSVLAFAGALVLALNPVAASAAAADLIADAVVGQPAFTSNEPNSNGVNASSVYRPIDVDFDRAGNMWVADHYNHRVLGYRAPMATDRVADLVIGQPDFNSNTANNGGVSDTSLFSPSGVATDAAGNLYIADQNNSRVLEFDDPFATDARADRVFGQPDLWSNFANNGGVLASTLHYPAGVAVDAAGNLWVADRGNNRVLGYAGPLAGDELERSADIVLGQPDFSTRAENNGSLSARSLLRPWGVAVDSLGNVWVADLGNNRVLEYDEPFTTFDTTADRILGQPNFMTQTANFRGGVDAEGLDWPTGVAVDGNGNVYVADSFNNRVLFYRSPIATSDRIADAVFGQPGFGSNAANNGGVSASSLNRPYSVALDAAGNVAVADYENSRVLVLEAPMPSVSSISVSVSPKTGQPQITVRGSGMVADSAVVCVNGTPLATTRYREVAADGSAHRVIAKDPSLDALFPPGTTATITILNLLTGAESAPFALSR